MSAGVLDGSLELLVSNVGSFQLDNCSLQMIQPSFADLKEMLCRMIPEFGMEYKRRKLRVNLGISKVMICTRSDNSTGNNVGLKVELF